MDGYLILEDKTVFPGHFSGFPREIKGEVVFTTGMTGYPQSLTDPSYQGQILVFTYPLIGNYGIPQPIYSKGVVQNFESEKIHVSGAIVSSLVIDKSHWQAKKTLDQWFKENKIPILQSVDTRALTQKLRRKGVMKGIISPKLKIKRKKLKFIDPNKDNLVSEVSCKKPIIYKNGSKKILLIDLGVKAGILRELQNLKTTIIRIPWNFDPIAIPLQIDGVVISNGPGNPKKIKKTIQTVRRFLKKRISILGICLGNQILALAAGGDTYKLKYGHRSVNQPVLLKKTNKAYITSQNHNYVVRMKSLGNNWEEWFVNINDGTNEGIKHKRLPFMATQFHPEGNPGPTDTKWIFEEFIKYL